MKQTIEKIIEVSFKRMPNEGGFDYLKRLSREFNKGKGCSCSEEGIYNTKGYAEMLR